MLIVLYVIAVLMIAGGGFGIFQGAGMIVLERGWSAVIAGSVFATGGFLVLALAFVVRELRALPDRLEAVDADLVDVLAARSAVAAPAAAGSEPSPDAAAIPAQVSDAAAAAPAKEPDVSAGPVPDDKGEHAASADMHMPKAAPLTIDDKAATPGGGEADHASEAAAPHGGRHGTRPAMSSPRPPVLKPPAHRPAPRPASDWAGRRSNLPAHQAGEAAGEPKPDASLPAAPAVPQPSDLLRPGKSAGKSPAKPGVTTAAAGSEPASEAEAGGLASAAQGREGSSTDATGAAADKRSALGLPEPSASVSEASEPGQAEAGAPSVKPAGGRFAGSEPAVPGVEAAEGGRADRAASEPGGALGGTLGRLGFSFGRSAQKQEAHEPPARAPMESAPVPVASDAPSQPGPKSPAFDHLLAPPPASAPAAPVVAPEPPPAAAQELSAPTVVGTYSAGATLYVMYSDGSIEADTPDGVYRFKSLDELKAHVARVEEGGAGASLDRPV